MGTAQSRNGRIAEAGVWPWANHLIPVELAGAAANAHLAERNRLAKTDHPGLIAYLGEFYGQINAVARGDVEPTLRIVGYMAQLDSAIESAEPSEKRLQVFRASPRDSGHDKLPTCGQINPHPSGPVVSVPSFGTRDDGRRLEVRQTTGGHDRAL